MHEPTGEGNGLSFDRQERLMMCEGGKPPGLTDRSRWQRGHAGQPLIGKRLNRPSDVVCRPDGSIYFTGPGMLHPPDCGFGGSAYRLHFLTACSSLSAMRVKVPGIKVP